MRRPNQRQRWAAPAAALCGVLALSAPLAQTSPGPRKADTTQKKASAKPEEAGVLASDPNHVSAVKALEQIRREEEESFDGTFSYRPGGRRDPFLSPQDILKMEISGRVCEGEGIECWLIQDVTIIGVLSRKNGNVALVIGPDGYGTTLKEGDRLYDGEVRRIDAATGLVVFRQRVNDPARIKPFRDVEKGLNLTKEGRS